MAKFYNFGRGIKYSSTPKLQPESETFQPLPDSDPKCKKFKPYFNTIFVKQFLILFLNINFILFFVYKWNTHSLMFKYMQCFFFFHSKTIRDILLKNRVISNKTRKDPNLTRNECETNCEPNPQLKNCCQPDPTASGKTGLLDPIQDTKDV